jgi:hypothetical protein
MKRIHKIFAWALIAIQPLLAGCSDRLETIDPQSHGAMTFTLVSGKSDEVSRSFFVGDKEFLIGKTHFFFYKLKDGKKISNNEDEYLNETAVIHRYVTVNDYQMSTYTMSFTDEELKTLFGDDDTTCGVYAVSNVPEDVDKKITENSTIAEIKALVVESDFSEYENYESFVMDGAADITLDRSTTTMKSTLYFKRAAAKVTFQIYVTPKMYVNATDYYVPSNTTDAMSVKVYNTMKCGKIDGTFTDDEKTDDMYVDYTRALDTPTYQKSTLDGIYYYLYTLTYPIYTYPSEWSKGSKNLHVNFSVEFEKHLGDNDENPTKEIYYYQATIPSMETNKVQRNNQYTVYFYVRALGSTLEGSVIDETPLTYEVADWTNDGAELTAQLDRNHYLVVDDNNYEVFNQSTVEFNYQSCTEDVSAYIADVKYVSTRFTNTTDTTIYLYKANYNETTNKYVPQTTGFTGNTATVRTEKSKLVTAIQEMVEGDKMLTQTYGKDEYGNEDRTKGTIKLYVDVSEIAEQLYRPITYTIALVNGTGHRAARQLVNITQYPSKYVEFGTGGDVFVNGYFAKVSAGTILNVSPYYKSYPFTLDNFEDTYATLGYYQYHNTYDSGTTVQDYGSVRSNNKEVSELFSINTSYEYLHGSNQSTLSLNNTTNVHVTAFSAEDHSFSVTNDQNQSSTIDHNYRIGDPRVDGGFKTFDHNSTTYDASGDMIYDYYVGEHSTSTSSETWDKGKWVTTTTNYYYRHVQPWLTNAGKIKVGGGVKYDDVIAPLYKVQSSEGALVGEAYFDVAKKRCATYQEAGYPAGRWRLPTLAEIAFIVKLQAAGAISKLFVTTSSDYGYWTSSGGRIRIDRDDDSKYFYYEKYNTGTEKIYARCVYDLWYWGTAPEEDTTTYYPKPYF